MANPQIPLPTEIVTSDKTPRTAIAFNRTSGVKQQSDTAREILLIGQMGAASTVAANTPTPLLRETDSEAFVQGCPLDIAAKAAFKANPNIKLSAVGITDAGTKASATVTIASTATATGEEYFYIMGRKVTLSVTSGDTPTVQATALAAAINAIPDLPVTASPAAGVVTITLKVGGLIGNTLTLSWLPPVGFVSGSTYTLSGAFFTGGLGTVVTTGATAAAAGKRYHIIGSLLDDQATEQALRDYAVAQGQAEIGLGEIVITALVGTLSAQTVQALAVNGLRSQHAGINGSPSWFPEIVGAYAAVEASYETATVPRNGQILTGIKPPPIEKRWTKTEIRTLIDNGVTPLKVFPGEVVGIVRAVSTNVTNTAGNKDYSVLDITKVLAFDDIRDNTVLMFDTNYQQARWADSDPNGELPADVATPEKVAGDLLTVLRQCQARGICSGVEALAPQIVVNKVGTQCQFSMPAKIVDGLHEKLGQVVYISTPFGS